MTKDNVLAILKNHTEYVSGEKISAMIGVSRMAVSAAVKSLREEGYEIASSTNKGYLLTNAPDLLNPGEIMGCLPKDNHSRLICLDTVDSTNRYLKSLALNGAADRTVVIANEQTAGKGRGGRSFCSPKNKGLYLSILLYPDRLYGNGTGMQLSDSLSLTACTAVAVRNAILESCGLETQIKWLNDLIAGGRKISGILTEMSVESESGRVEYVIIGIGINVNQEASDFDETLSCKASSLFLQSGKKQSRAGLAAALIRECNQIFDEFPKNIPSCLSLYRKYNITPGRNILLRRPDGDLRGRAVSVCDDFSLQVETEDGQIIRICGGGLLQEGFCWE